MDTALLNKVAFHMFVFNDGNSAAEGTSYDKVIKKWSGLSATARKKYELAASDFIAQWSEKYPFQVDYINSSTSV